MVALRRFRPLGLGSIALLAAAFTSSPAPVPAGELPPIVFVSRSLGTLPAPEGRPAAIHVASSGSLLILTPEGTRRALVDARANPAQPVDVMDPEVSYDGRNILFAGYMPAEKGWRIFEVEASSGRLRQITRSDRNIDLTRHGEAAKLFETYDDLDPCYLPDGRICFVSTRYPQIAPDGRQRATNLYVSSAEDGSDLHRITTERFGADTPTVDPGTGKIVYSRWWRSGRNIAKSEGAEPEPVPPGSPGYGDVVIDESNAVLRALPEASFPGVNSWFLSSLKPDGTELVMFSGFRLDRGLTQAHRPSFKNDGSVLALFIPQTPFLGYPRGNGLRSFVQGPVAPTGLGGPQTFTQQNFPFPPGAADDPARPPELPPVLPFSPFLYASAVELPDGRYLVTAAQTLDPAHADYGIQIQEGASAPVPLYDVPGSAELDAVPLVSRSLPPIVADRVTDRLSDEIPKDLDAAFSQGKFTFLCENIHFNAPVDFAIPHAPPVGHRLAIEFYTNPQRTSPTGGDAPILIKRLDIPTSGRIEAELPAGVPLFEVLRRTDGELAVGRDGQIFHVGGFNFGRAGETSRCVGCHAGHSQLAVPAEVSWTNVAPSALVGPRTEQGNVVDAIFKQLFSATNLVDRRTDEQRIWLGPEGQDAIATLTWTTLLRAREVIVRAAPPENPALPDQTQRISAFTLMLKQGETPILAKLITEEISRTGTRVAIDPTIEFDRLELTIRPGDVQGTYLGSRGPALAEIEVIGQASGEPRTLFLRGDSDCNSGIDISDAIVTLIHLFLGGRTVCCEAAADANDDGLINLSDPIFLLGALFLGGGQVIPMQSPECGQGSHPELSCDRSPCF